MKLYSVEIMLFPVIPFSQLNIRTYKQLLFLVVSREIEREREREVGGKLCRFHELQNLLLHYISTFYISTQLLWSKYNTLWMLQDKDDVSQMYDVLPSKFLAFNFMTEKITPY